jgi:hypothetical protein
MVGDKPEQLFIKDFEKLRAFLPRRAAQARRQRFFDFEVMSQRF